MARGESKEQRRSRIIEYLQNNIFATDEELAQHYSVSVQTIRLDRAALGIPELRERVKQMAEQNYSQIKSIRSTEVIGDLLELKLNDRGMSLLVVTEDMVLDRSKIIRGHYLFAQANSLAVAIVDSSTALTGTANVKYISPVNFGAKVICRAELLSRNKEKYNILVSSSVNNNIVFTGDFLVFAKEGKVE